MARTVADHLADHDITHVVASSLLRAQETATPVAEAHGVAITTDDRVIEAANDFEGQLVGGMNPLDFVHPSHWSKLVNPFRPSWGEAYAEVAERMLAAIADARTAARGHEAVIVSHQLPIWTARNALMGKRLWHDPRKRECRLASLTTLTYLGDDLESLTYSEPAAVLLAQSHGGTG
jgi:broad specificity phosphatase PhoE